MVCYYAIFGKIDCNNVSAEKRQEISLRSALEAEDVAILPKHHFRKTFLKVETVVSLKNRHFPSDFLAGSISKIYRFWGAIHTGSPEQTTALDSQS